MPVLVCQGCYNKAPPTEWLQQQKCILSQPWRLEIPNQGGVRAMLPLKVLGKDLFQASLFLGLWQHNSRLPLFIRTPATLDQGPTPLWSDPILTNYTRNNPNSEYSPILRY